MIFGKPRSLKKMLSEKQVFATCVWNYMSARAAEKAGFEATLLASGPLSANKIGYNDLGLVTLDEFVWETERITNRSPLPLILDAENGFGDSPLYAHRTAQRLIKAGAQALQLEDTMGIRGYARLFYAGQHDQIIPEKDWLAKIRAVKAATEGTDCIIIARTEAFYSEGLNCAVDRCNAAIEAGADMTLMMGINNGPESLELCTKISKLVPGWKMYPDVDSHNGVADLNIDDLAPLGFNLVTCHCMEKGAWYGMMEWGKHVISEESTVYHNDHDMGCSSALERTDMLGADIREWLAFEKKCYEE